MKNRVMFRGKEYEISSCVFDDVKEGLLCCPYLDDFFDTEGEFVNFVKDLKTEYIIEPCGQGRCCSDLREPYWTVGKHYAWLNDLVNESEPYAEWIDYERYGKYIVEKYGMKVWHGSVPYYDGHNTLYDVYTIERL